MKTPEPLISSNPKKDDPRRERAAITLLAAILAFGAGLAAVFNRVAPEPEGFRPPTQEQLVSMTGKARFERSKSAGLYLEFRAKNDSAELTYRLHCRSYSGLAVPCDRAGADKNGAPIGPEIQGREATVAFDPNTSRLYALSAQGKDYLTFAQTSALYADRPAK